MENTAVNYNTIDVSRHQILFQHGNADGYITLAQKDATTNSFRQWHYRPEELVEHLTEFMGENVYYSQNTFYKPQRSIENIRQLRSLYVDVDFYTKDYDKEWILGKLEHEFYGQSIPEPNLIIFSGRGLVLIWLIDAVPYKALPLWQAVQNYLTNELSTIGADQKCTDAARIFRLGGTTNSKNGAEVRVEYRHAHKYTLRDIQFDYLPDLTPKVTPQKGKKANGRKKVVKLFNTYTLHYARLLDLVKLAELRGYDFPNKREIVCFLYRYWQCCFLHDTKDALQQTLDFNQRFTKPLSKKEVERATKSAEKAYEARSNDEANKIAIQKGYPGAGYNISNRKLIKWLEITTDEMTHLQTIIDGAEKRRRNTLAKMKKRREAGVRPREEYLQEKQNKLDILDEALTMYPDVSVRQLVKITGLKKSTIQRLKNELLK